MRFMIRMGMSVVVAHSVMAVGTGVHAQQAVASQIASQSSPSVTSRPVTIHLEKVTVEHAVRAITANAGVRAVYDPDELDECTTSVTLTAVSMPLGAALEHVLRGTGFQAEPVTQDGLRIGRAYARGVPARDGTIAGRVINGKTKQPIVGARVVLDNTQSGVTSGSDGSFRLTVAPGEHRITIRAVGFVRQNKPVTVADGQVISLDVVLDPSASVLDEVVVTGTVVATERKAISTPITVITAEEIERRGITRVDQLMRGEIPGLFAAEMGTNIYNDTLGAMIGTRMYSRGSSKIGVVTFANPIKTYVDGVELVDPSYLGTIDPKSVERIEVITGPQAATIYGSGALGGVMQIFTKRGSGMAAPDLNIRVMYGMLQNNVSNGLTPMHNHSISTTGGAGVGFSYAVTGSYRYTGQWQPGLFIRNMGMSVGATHTRGDVVANGALSTTRATNGTVNRNWGGPYERAMRESGEYALYAGAVQMSQRISTSSSLMASGSIDYTPFTVWQHHMTVGRNQTDLGMEPTAPGFSGPSDTLFASMSRTGVRTTLGYNTTYSPRSFGLLTTTMTVGMNGSFGKQSNVSGCQVASTSTSLIHCTSSTGGPTVTQTVGDKTWGGFGSWRIGFFDRLYLTLGLRGERSPNYGEAHKIDWTPTNGLAYTIEHNDLSVKFLGSYGKATRVPDPDRRLEFRRSYPGYDKEEFIIQYANPDLTPEYESGPQGGIEVYYGNRGMVSVNYFNQRVTDMVWRTVLKTDTLTFLSSGTRLLVQQAQYLNLSEVHKFGWESTGSLTFGDFNIRGTYTWNESRIVETYPGYPSTGTYHSGFSLMTGTPTHFGNLTFNYARGGLAMTLSNQILGKAARTNNVELAHPTAFEWSSSRLRTYVGRYSGVASWMQDGYVKSDLIITRRISPWVTGSLTINNVGDSYTGETTVLNPSLGRQTQVGVMMKLPR